MTPNTVDEERATGEDTPLGILPSQFMRKLRPEYYSDTRERTSYILSASQLEYHLQSLTARNQTHDFEIFCRKLCERTICPNLRPQTGPDGGGDSKADTETYPVSDEISALTYVGQANGARERWAFAFSAKAKWAEKARKDIKGIAETARGYDRIFFVTSCFAKAKDRARVEDELSKEYGIPIIIHDRSWIVEEVVAKDRRDLAFNYLNVGEEAGSQRLGPTDYSRSQQLADTEKAIEDPESFRGMKRQLVTEALVAAKLSRGLERPRAETDGRFARAVRLAEAHGSYRQRLEAEYEHIWTAHWWFDDIRFLNASYDSFESRALHSDHARNLELLGNLHQLLVNSIAHGHMTPEECLFDERTAKLKQALETAAQDPNRPNSSLEAQTGLLRIELNRASMEHDAEALSALWQAYARVLEKAGGLGEFDADSLVRVIEVAGQVAGNDPAYNDLTEKLAAFVGSRKSEAEGALVLLKRAQKLDFKDKFDMIRWLGKAATGLTKREYAESLIEAVQLLTLAYRSAGLPWAARASCVFAVASIIIEGEEVGELPPGIVPTLKLWAWNALERCHLPDFLFAVQFLRGCVAGLPLAEESKSKVQEDIRELDFALGCLFLNLEEKDLRRVEGVPDILEALGLVTARAALLYILGYSDVLREDGSLPAEEPDEGVERLLSILKSQPIAESLRGPLLLNEQGRHILATTIIGMKVEVEIEGPQFIALAESILGSLEAFFATVIGAHVAPHTELFRITVTTSDQVQKPVIETSELDMTSKVTWPSSLKVTRFDQQNDVRAFYSELAGNVMGATCVVEDANTLVRRLFTDEGVQHRIGLIAAAPNSYTRVTSGSFSQLSDWQEAVHRSYPLRPQRTVLPRVALRHSDEYTAEKNEDDDEGPAVTNHRGMSVRSVVDVHAWDQARWRGCGYLEIAPSQPPCMAFLFENGAAARKIFERWRQRFGNVDADEEIGISIIKELPGSSIHHYCIQIASNDLMSRGEVFSRTSVLVATRSMTMEPSNSKNLDMFLAGYARCSAYYLLPGIGMTNPEFFFDLAVMKRRLSVKSAAEIAEHDIEALALRIRGLKFAS